MLIFNCFLILLALFSIGFGVAIKDGKCEDIINSLSLSDTYTKWLTNGMIAMGILLGLCAFVALLSPNNAMFILGGLAVLISLISNILIGIIKYGKQ
ncbi:MAG: hypothetical protein IKM24_10920 [Clostridia bacterium]|nr:hypothetical protein [Clostridia bacterium]